MLLVVAMAVERLMAEVLAMAILMEVTGTEAHPIHLSDSFKFS